MIIVAAARYSEERRLWSPGSRDGDGIDERGYPCCVDICHVQVVGVSHERKFEMFTYCHGGEMRFILFMGGY
jgi:hypothetical protein